MAKVTIDGIEVEVQEGINVIEAAKAADVHVPHFCYHPSLSIVGQCRMCLVEVEGMPKLQAGCATPVRDGMKIHVWNEKVDHVITHRKPVGLQAKLIEAITSTGDVVLDPAAGSYSVLDACRRTGREFLGCDLRG